MKRLIVGLVLLAVAAAAFWLYNPSGAVDEPTAIKVSGNIEVTDAGVSFKIPGRIEARLVSEGELVEAGQVVARLAREELAQEVALRQADVRAAETDLAELAAGSRPEDIAQAEAALDLANAEAERWQVEAARQADLYAKDVVSARERETAETAHRVALARVREAEERLALLRKGPRAEQIAQLASRSARAREARTLAEMRLGFTLVRAPMTGVVLADHVEAGEYVGPGTPVITIGALDTMWLRAYIDETDLGRVKLGQRVQVSTDTYPDKTYDGVVSFIASEAEFTPKNVQTDKERVKLVYRVKVDVPNPASELKPGMPADGRILVATPVAAEGASVARPATGPRG